MKEKVEGNSNTYATSPSVYRISERLIYLGQNLSFLLNLITPFLGNTRKKTLPTTLNLNG